MFKQGNMSPTKGGGGGLYSSSFATKGMQAKGTFSDASSTAVSAASPQAATKDFGDDILCQAWLEEVGLPQYEDTFSTNLSVGGGLLSRRRLGQIRLQDLPRMNITNYDHQKILINHIRHSLQFAYKSPIRKKEVNEKFPAITKAEAKNTSSLKDLKNDLKKVDFDKSDKSADHRTDINKSSRRRRSFDNQVWQSIDKLRAEENHQNPTLDALRAGKFNELASAPSKQESDHLDTGDKPKRTRRRSFGDNNNPVQNKAILYGNMALEYDMIQKELATLQTEDLNRFRDVIGCDKASIFFINHKTAEMMLHSDNQWFKIPVGSGIAGYCAQSGETLNIPDAYKDPRFNKELDFKTGFRTRNILCQPVRANRGGGHIIGVIQFLNKKNGHDFNDNDELVIDACVAKVSDELGDKFKELLNAAELFASHAIGIGKANRAYLESK